ncbi:MAG: hypothetical protein RBU30_08195 [Polyangia bacterium]|jgi:hypothetical protein|nr:hypothetical protein [Polyangia bacterium]
MTAKAHDGPGEPLAAILLGELLATPAVKALIEAGGPAGGAPHGPARTAPAVVRTLLWQDVNTSLSLAKELPQLANALFSGLEALAEELSRFPDPVLGAFTTEVLAALDLAAVRRAGEAWLRLGRRALASRARPAPESKAQPDQGAFTARDLGELLFAPALGALSAWLSANPEGLRRLAHDLLDPFPPEELRLLSTRASAQLAALLQDYPALSEALARLVASLAWEAVQGSLRAMAGRLRRAV